MNKELEILKQRDFEKSTIGAAAVLEYKIKSEEEIESFSQENGFSKWCDCQTCNLYIFGLYFLFVFCFHPLV